MYFEFGALGMKLTTPRVPHGHHNFSIVVTAVLKTISLLLVHIPTILSLIEAEWRIYASVNKKIIGSDNGLSPDRRQAIIWTNAWNTVNLTARNKL